MDFSFLINIYLTLLFIFFSSITWNLFFTIIYKPYLIQKRLSKQGIKGPPYIPLHGSLKEMKLMNMKAREVPMESFSHDIVPRVNSSYYTWSKIYGDMFVFWYGVEARVIVTDADMVKDIFSTKFEYFVKSSTRPSIKALLGKGLLLVDGADWVKHRRVINPAFHIDRLKGMSKRMTNCTMSMLEEWEKKYKEIDVHEELKTLTANIIAHTAFGTSYAQGKEVFKVQEELISLAVSTGTDFFIPGSQYLPTKNNRQVWELEKRAYNTLLSIINPRIENAKKGGSFGDDLLEVMLESSRSDDRKQHQRMDLSLNIDEIMSERMTFFFAGHETTSNLLTWVMFLLSIYPQWQNKLREEVTDVCGTSVPDADIVGKLKLNKLREEVTDVCRTSVPDADIVGKLKLVTMVLMEALRIYCPVLEMFREAAKDMKLSDVIIPKGTTVTIPILMVHTKEAYWGEDVHEFNPLRFLEGLSKAAGHPNTMFPFSIGPRTCIGQNFAMLESKIVLAMILQRYSFSLAPSYNHAPVQHLTLQPQFGLPVVFEPLHP